jgi:uncharacterized protein
VLFRSDASALDPDEGGSSTAWSGTRAGSVALALALTELIRNGDVDRARAQEIATMVLRTNASKLYKAGSVVKE